METMLTRAPSNSVWENIYENLRARILSFDILPSTVLSENALSTELNVSRAPVRDAMTRLVEEGYIIVYPQRGTVVSLIDQERVRQSVFMRVVLEHTVIEQLCHKQLTDAQLSNLEHSLQNQHALIEEHKILEMLEEDDRMHQMLYEYSERPYTQEAFRMLNSDQMRVRYLQMHTFSYSARVQLSPMTGWDNCLLEHRMLIEAIKKGDSDAACLLDMNHINAVMWNADSLQKIYPQYFSSTR